MRADDRGEDARRAIFTAIRGHLAASAPYDAVRNEHAAHGPAQAAPSPPALVTADAAGEKLERFRRELEAVAGQSTVVRSKREAADALERIVEHAQARRVAVSDAAIVRSVVGRLRSSVDRLDAATPAELFACDVGVTAAQWGVAETGTLVLESGAERHRLLSLVPPVHVAILEASRILSTLGEALAAVRGQGARGLSPTVTFVTGPSRTSDIELVLAIGVHGPQVLHVVILNR
jgi:L-lactate utilization protein LutC